MIEHLMMVVECTLWSQKGSAALCFGSVAAHMQACPGALHGPLTYTSDVCQVGSPPSAPIVL